MFSGINEVFQDMPLNAQLLVSVANLYHLVEILLLVFCLFVVCMKSLTKIEISLSVL